MALDDRDYMIRSARRIVQRYFREVSNTRPTGQRVLRVLFAVTLALVVVAAVYRGRLG